MKYSYLLGSVAALSLMMAPSLAISAPQGGVVSGGAATISTLGTKTDIHQSTQKAVIDWRSFNIGANEHTQFHQPSSSSITLNRINDVKASQINGKLTANGHIMLINPNGVVFGAGSQVDVGSLTASTADIDNDDFMAGNMNFQHAGRSDGTIINSGTITAKEAGLVTLVAPQVENHGIIRAKLGKIQLAAADTFTLDMVGDGLIQVAVSDENALKLARNTGTISAESGIVQLSATYARHIVDSLVENSGTITAGSLTRTGGKIILSADQGTVKVSGSLDVSGALGGGEILVGGGYQGKGNIKTALNTEVTDSAILKANATDAGDGGKIIVWADENTVFAGKAEARGGINGGDGGFVETSGKVKLKVGSTASIDVSAANGRGGEWLLDPTNITITDGGGDVDTATINATLNGGGNVTITTVSGGVDAGIITMTNATIDKSVANNDVTLSLIAEEDIVISNTTLTSTSGDALSVVLNADSDANQSGYISITNSSFTTNGGDFTAGGGANPLTTAAWGNAALNDGITLNNADINTGAGAISLRGHGRDDAASNFQIGVDVNNGSVLESTTGNITLNGTGGAGTAADYGVYIRNIGTLIRSDEGAIDITGTGGSTGLAGSGGNIGLFIASGSDITSTGIGVSAASITLNGTGGAGGSSNYGVLFQTAGTSITSADGAIDITGTGGSNGAVGSLNNYGIYSDSGSDITSTGTGANAGSITLNGTGGAGEDNNYGVYLISAGTLITSAYGAIDITGTGGSNGLAGSNNNVGVYLINGADITSTGTGADAATITLNGTGGDGDSENIGVFLRAATTLITSVDGAIDITGQGGSNGAAGSNGNYGVYLTDADITSTGTGVNAATITLDGTGGAGEDSNYGIYLRNSGASVTSVDGAIDITGTGGSNGIVGSANNYGIYFINGADVTSTGTGANAATITLNGTGGAGDDTNHGVFLQLAGTSITSVDGAINVTGTGGSNGLAGSITNLGLYVSGADITSTGTGADAATITLDGTGGDGEDTNYGVYLTSVGTLVTSVAGAIDITGVGGSNGIVGSINNYGIYLDDDADITSTGIGGNAATVTLDGTGGAGSGTNYGVSLMSAGTSITSIDGAIDITGNTGAGAGNTNSGIVMNTGAIIHSTGTGVNAATITLDGESSSTGAGNNGVVIDDATTEIVSTDGDILINAQGGDGSNGFGFYLQNSGKVKSLGTGADAANITINGTGGNGTSTNHGVYSWGSIETVDGDINLTGTTSTVTAASNYGIWMRLGADIISTGTGVNAGTITVSGTGGNGTDTNYGIQMTDSGTTIQSIDGAINVTGTGGSNGLAGSTDNYGLHILGGADIISTGTGVNAASITITGTGGTGDDLNHGVYFSGAGTSINAIDGAIDITGTGGAGDDLNFGVFSSLADITSVNGNISVTATGGSNGTAGSDTNVGLYLNRSNITSTGTGVNAATITINGTGGAGGDRNFGVLLENSSALITSIDGAIDITGTGGTNGTAGSYDNHGLYLLDGADVISTGTGVNAATITITGTGGAGEDDNYGVYLTSVGTSITSVDGAIDITGTGNSNGGADSDFNYGVFVESDADIISTGNTTDAATITIDGTGGAGDDNNHGIYVTSNGTLIQSEIGDITLTGQGGSIGGGGTNMNNGIWLTGNADITSIGVGANAADITLVGTGGNGGQQNSGISIQSSGSALNTIDGDISLTGQGQGTGLLNLGVIVLNNANIFSTGTGVNAGTITINGAGGAGSTLNSGVYLAASGTSVQSIDGDIDITATGGGSGVDNHGLFIENGADIITTGDANLTLSGQASIAGTGTDIITSGGVIDIGGGSATGNYTFTADTISLADVSIETTGDLTIAPRTANTSIGIGGAAGTLNLSDAELALLTVGGTLNIGDSAAGTGVVTIDSTDVTAGGYDLSVYGGDITVNGNLDGGGKVWLSGRGAANDLTLNANVSATGAGNSLVLATEGDFINNVGAGVLDADTGRWLVYSAHPDTITKGGLTGAHLYNRNFNADAPSSIAGAADNFVYNFQPTLTFTADDITLSGDDPGHNNFTYTFVGLYGSDTQGQAFSGTPAFVKTNISSGQYNIGINTGSLLSNMGYGFSFVDGLLETSTPQQTLGPSVLSNLQAPEGTLVSEDVAFYVGDNNPNSALRLIAGDFMEIEQPVVDFFQLCSYDNAYCVQ